MSVNPNNMLDYNAKKSLPAGAGTKDMSNGEPMGDSPAGLGEGGVKGSPESLQGGSASAGKDSGSEALSEFAGIQASHGLSHIKGGNGLKSSAGTPIDIPREGGSNPVNRWP